MSAIIGIDPSLTATGIAHASGHTTTSKGGKGDQRLRRLYADVISAAGQADYAVIEDLPTHAMGAGLTGRAQGVVRLALMRMDVPYVTVTPASLKQFATNTGNASKDDMAIFMGATLGEFRKGLDDNQVDAWWLRQMGLVKLGLAEPTSWQAAVLDKVTKKKGKPDKAAIDWSPWWAL